MTSRWLGLLAGAGIAGGFWLAPALASAPWLAERVEHAVEAGADSTLPPIMSVVLGVAKKEQATSVRQLVGRAGDRVHTFNVSVADHAKIVLTNVDERAHVTTAYLVSPKGALRKAIIYAAGKPAEQLTSAAARPEFRSELDYWSRWQDH